MAAVSLLPTRWQFHLAIPSILAQSNKVSQDGVSKFPPSNPFVVLNNCSSPFDFVGDSMTNK